MTAVYTLYVHRLLTLKLGVSSSSHIHLSSGLGGDSGHSDGIWAFLKFIDVSPQEASTVMLGSFTQRYDMMLAVPNFFRVSPAATPELRTPP